MNRNLIRLGLAGAAAFYVVVGGLWASDYFPLQNFYAQAKVQESIIDEMGVAKAIDSEEYNASRAAEQTYAITHGDIMETERKLALYGSLLLWGTVALGIVGGVLYFTRQRKGETSGPATD
jgi:hypothetical protein